MILHAFTLLCKTIPIVTPRSFHVPKRKLCPHQTLTPVLVLTIYCFRTCDLSRDP